MADQTIRLKQRLSNYKKAINNLKMTIEKESLNEIEKAGLIQFFEVGFELAWKLMKDYLDAQGYQVRSPRDSIKTAFRDGLIEKADIWLEALEKRNLASHTYDAKILDELEALIKNTYVPLMVKLEESIENK